MRIKKTNICFFVLLVVLFLKTSSMEINWDKVDIAIDNLSFENKNSEEPFLFGVSASAYQVEGEMGAMVKPYNQWNRWEGKDLEENGIKKKPVPYFSGDACDHWNRYKEDIQLMKDLGFKAYRFSVSWGKIEPKENEFNEEALRHYEDVCQELVDQGIQPIITLYHYTHPCWFEDKGGFEKVENSDTFKRFCVTVFERLQKYNPIWFTFSSFVGYAFPAYYKGSKPPFKKDMRLAFGVLKNMLDAHVSIYRDLKKRDETATVGIHKTIFHVDPYFCWNPLDQLLCFVYNKMMNNSVYDFFTNGVLKLWVPTKVTINHENKEAKGALDCVGVSYYSGMYMSNGSMIPREELIQTQDEKYTIYPEGFYRALKQVSEKMAKPLKVPVYITENGIAARKENHRDIFFKRHLHVLSKALKDGMDIRGYCVWTLMDNFEWSDGFEKKKYGICEVDFETQERKPRESVKYLIDVAKKHCEKH